MTREPVNGRLIVLCERLAESTRAGAAEWDDEGNDRFLWRHAEGSVRVGARDGDGEPPYELTISNDREVRVEELESALLGDDVPAPWNEPLADLYRTARRSALKADELIDALIAALPGDAGGGRRSTASLTAD
ncbi:MAG TPA: hypothetical protein VFO88_09750 [Gaiellaceae bacterium]|nr:hypothetical protein [Gaiellaceae bacterium]